MVNLTEEAKKSTPTIYRFMKAARDDMEAQGLRTINFTVGDPSQPVYGPTLDGIKKFIDDKMYNKPHTYTGFAGLDKFRKRIINAFNERHGTDYNYKNVVLTNGANDAIRMSLHLCVPEGGSLIAPAPCFLSYLGMLKEDKRKILLFSTLEDGYKLDSSPGGKLDRVIEELYQKDGASKGISRDKFVFTLLDSDPGNPTSYKRSKFELEGLRDLFLNKWKGGNIIADCLYLEITHDKNRMDTILSVSKGTELENRIMYIDSISKPDGLASWRGGFAVSKDESFADRAMANYQLLGGVHPSILSQYATVLTLENRKYYVRENAEVYGEKSSIVFNRLNKIGVMPFETNASFYGIKKLSFMKDVPVSEQTLKFYQEFNSKADISKIKTTNDDQLLSGLEYARRTGIFTVPLIQPTGDHIVLFSEDKDKFNQNLVRIVPNIGHDLLHESCDRTEEYHYQLQRGNVDFSLSLEKKSVSIPGNGNHNAASGTKITAQTAATPAFTVDWKNITEISDTPTNGQNGKQKSHVLKTKYFSVDLSQVTEKGRE